MGAKPVVQRHTSHYQGNERLACPLATHGQQRQVIFPPLGGQQVTKLNSLYDYKRHFRRSCTLVLNLIYFS